MLVKRMYFPVSTLGPGKRVVIYTSGCMKRCKGCMSKALQSFDDSCNKTIKEIISLIKQYPLKEISGVTISGGEPFLQEDLDLLVTSITSLGIDDILVYSGYTYEQLKAFNKEYINNTLKTIGVLIDGEYKEELNDNHPLRGSSNQRIIFIKPELRQKYDECLKGKREFQMVERDGSYDFYGLFPKNMEKTLKETFGNNSIDFISSNK